MDNKKRFYRNKVGLEDIAVGTGTQQQTRNGQVVTITKINAGNLPFDETQSFMEAITTLSTNYSAVFATANNINNVNAVGSNINNVINVDNNINSINVVYANMSSVVNIGSDSELIADIKTAEENAVIAKAAASDAQSVTQYPLLNTTSSIMSVCTNLIQEDITLLASTKFSSFGEEMIVDEGYTVTIEAGASWVVY